MDMFLYRLHHSAFEKCVCVWRGGGGLCEEFNPFLLVHGYKVRTLPNITKYSPSHIGKIMIFLEFLHVYTARKNLKLSQNYLILRTSFSFKKSQIIPKMTWKKKTTLWM